MNSGYGGYGGYNSMGFGMNNGYNNNIYNNNYNNTINNNNNNNSDNNQMGFGFQVMYGILSGSQSLLSIAGAFIDIAYFIKQAKALIFDFIIYLIKKLFNMLKYLITLKWLINTGKSINNNVNKHLLTSKYFSSFVIFIKLLSVLSKIIYRLIFIIDILSSFYWMFVT